MTKSLTDDRLKTVAHEFSAVYNNMIPLVSRADLGGDLLLAKVLYFTSSKGPVSPKKELLKTALALEILRIAIDIGSVSQDEEDFSDDRLLSTDYLYAQAINQVVSLGKPFIISILATSIANTAADRANSFDENPDIEHLIVAAFKLGKRLGECGDDVYIGDILSGIDTGAEVYIKKSVELIS